MYEKIYHTRDISNLNILVTGGAGFIGSNLVEYLVKHKVKKVRILDNLSNGYISNIEKFIQFPNVEFINGDIRDLNICMKVCEETDYVLHQAALGSVPRSIADPITTNEVNINGFLNILLACRDTGVKRLIYAASSSTYGDSKELPKKEETIGRPLSPYAVTKYVNELYADVFFKTYGLESIGLRYFNVFGPRQSPNGAYAAVIPLFIDALRNNESASINGNGEQTRDFTFVENAVQANIKAMLVENKEATNEIYNIACGERTSLNNLWKTINELLNVNIEPLYRDNRVGDIQDSLADIKKATLHLNYTPMYKLKDGLSKLLS